MLEITIATSIVPRNFELQRAAIDSWLNLGFEVISLNPREEIVLLSPEFPGIRFEAASRTALDLAGKPYVFFDDILAVLNECGSEICGIINSDIHLRVGPDFVEQVRKTTATDFLCASRVDVATITDDHGKIYPYGFDVFFFPRKLILEYPASNFCMGAPWWDYWALLVPIAKGHIVRELVAPLAFHVTHESRWQSDLHGFFGDHLLKVAQSSDLFNESGETLLNELLPAYEGKNFFLASLLYLRYFQQHTESVQSEQSSGIDFFMSRQYVLVRDELVKVKISVYSLSGELEQLRSGLAGLNNASGSSSINTAAVQGRGKDESVHEHSLLCRWSRRLLNCFKG